MKKPFVTISVFVVLVGGYLFAAHLSGGAFPTFGLPLGGEVGHVRRQSKSFLEDLQFKDFVRAASYHTPEKRKEVDIPFIIQRLFAIKPENLDLMKYDIVLAEQDTSGLRARVKSRLKVKNLLDERITEKELMLYWEREAPGSPWYMKLEDSLRRLEGQQGKKF